MDLPHPDSPTIPRVSPCRTSSETPSTACTKPFGPPRRARERTGKCLTRSTVWRRTGAVIACALDRRAATGRSGRTAGSGCRHPFARATRSSELRPDRAAREAMQAARRETAPFGRREQRRRRARDRREPVHPRPRPEGSTRAGPRCTGAAGRGRPPPWAPPRRRARRTSRPPARRSRRRRPCRV